MDSDDDLPPLESDVANVHYSRRSLLALASPEEPAAAKRPEQPSALAVAAAKRSLDAPKKGASGGGEATTGGASPKKEAALWQAADLTCRSTVKGVRRRKPRPRPPATLIKKERHACGYASAPDEPSNGTEQRRRSLEYQTPPATPVQYDSEDDFFSPKKFREPEDFEHPSLDDDDGDRPRPRSSYVRSSSTALEAVLVEKPALSVETQQLNAAAMAEKRRRHLQRWPTRRQPHLVDTVTELREHFSGASRLDALRTRLTEEMKLRNMGIGDMFALVDDNKSLSLDASELHDMARRLNTNCRLQDAEQLVYERGERGEITIESFVEWFHEADDPLVRSKAERRRRCKTPSADLSKRRGYGVYGMGRAQAKQQKAFDSYAAQSIHVDFNNATDGQLLQVDACLLDVDVRRIVEQFWRLADQDKTGTLEYEEYIELSLNLQKALCVRNAEAEDLRGTVWKTKFTARSC